MFCNVCSSELGPPIYEAGSDQALTSLCEIRPGKVRVWLCQACGHLCGEPLLDTQTFYESDYRILLDHDEEDQIYEVHGERIVYRTDHQVDTLLKKLNLREGARVLDYGCAKAATPRRLLVSRPDLRVYLFDVSAMYLKHWQRFLAEDRWAMRETPIDWLGTFDVVTSFFALEHIPKPVDAVRKVANLLADDGVFYGIVPDTFGNVADFVVIDHVNHFTDCSLHALLREAGFRDIQIDSTVHRGALVFKARKTGPATQSPNLTACINASRQLVSYWRGMDSRIRNAETMYTGLPSAIYGSGFYGSYIFSLLSRPEHVQCFLDASPFQQSKTLFNRNIFAPFDIPENVRVLYIGLNPSIARATAASMSWLSSRDLRLVLLDEDSQC
jgi:SAM-dependent methyltransferase